MLKRLLILKLLIFSAWTLTSAQSPDNTLFYQDSQIHEADSNKLYFKLDNLNFFKNNEYFNKFVEGFTYIGYWVRPTFTYQPTGKVRIEAGAHMLQYSGVKGPTQFEPFYRVQYKMLPGIDLVMGNLYSTLNHNMIEPMYGFDRYINANSEHGIQFLFNNKRFTGDLWLNWEKFIFVNDPEKEQFSQGFTSRFLLTEPDKPLKIAVPIQYLFAHKGGQVTQDTMPLFTRMNLTGGLSAEYDINHRFIKSVSASAFFLYYRDNTFSRHIIPLIEGHGSYANIYLKTSCINFTVGYWNGFRFFNPRGEESFSNLSFTDPTYYETRRELILAKAFIHHSISKGIRLAAAFESYYDHKNEKYDYYYALYVLCNLKYLVRDAK